LNRPLGSKGQGVFKLVKAFDSEKIQELKTLMNLIDWFEDFNIPQELFATEARLTIKDRFLAEGINYFDQRSSNEGFLFLMFYFSLFISADTPASFAIDNIDASLNPKLCSKLISTLSMLANKYDKQVILTTHNPAVLDGLDLSDENQRLFVVYRNKVGHTKTKRVYNPEPSENQSSPLLSDLFMAGSIGGLPKNF
jgi:AAA15 family ATPase/GTPase